MDHSEPKTTSKTKVSKKKAEMTPEEMKQFVARKRECEALAQSIVIDLLEENIVSEELLLKTLPNLGPQHYEDITVERAIIGKCGYPFCKQRLNLKSLPSQTYRICANTNKVYDITTRKNFCSNGCYTKSENVKKQIPTKPLWLRTEKEKVEMRFELPSNDVAGSVGELIDVSIVEKIASPENEEKEKSFTSFLQFTQESLSEIEKNETPFFEGDEQSKSNVEASKTEKKHVIGEVKESRINSIDKKLSEEKNITTEKKNMPQTPTLDSSKTEIKPKSSTEKKKLLGDVKERRHENRIDPIISAGQKLSDLSTKHPPKKYPENPSSLSTVEKSLGEWFGIETLLHLFGVDRVREMVAGKSREVQEYLDRLTAQSTNSLAAYEQYQRLCQKLNLLELEDRKYDSEATKERKQMKPLPNYSMLQEESETVALKVRAFMKGETVIPKVSSETSGVSSEPKEDEEEPLPKLPLVEKHAQVALRRKIVLRSLDRILPDLLLALDLSSREISGDVRELIATFDLKAHNITFKTVHWNFVGLVIIKLLSVRASKLDSRLKMPKGYKHMELLLMSYNLDQGYLDRLIWWLTDIDRLLKNNQLDSLS